jgi:hypothetical protein
MVLGLLLSVLFIVFYFWKIHPKRMKEQQQINKYHYYSTDDLIRKSELNVTFIFVLIFIVGTIFGGALGL